MEFSSRDADLMAEAIGLARRGRHRVEPNPMVGCVIAREGKVLGRGWHADWGGAHAEVNALADAGDDLQGADVFVTLEPCSTSGKTPPCVDALLGRGLSRVVYALVDPNPKHAGAANARLAADGITVGVGLLAEEARSLLVDFQRHLGAQRPWVVLKWASTLDGRSAAADGQSQWITGPAARAEGHRERARSDAVLIGAGTALVDDPRLTVRAVEGRPPRRIVLDSRFRMKDSAKLFDTKEAPTTLVCCRSFEEEANERLGPLGVDVLAMDLDDEGRLPLDAVLQRLRRDFGIGRLMVEGGPRIAGAFADAGLVDHLRIFMAPRLMVDRNARSALDGALPRSMDDLLELEIEVVRTIENDLLIEARPRR